MQIKNEMILRQSLVKHFKQLEKEKWEHSIYEEPFYLNIQNMIIWQTFIYSN